MTTSAVADEGPHSASTMLVPVREAIEELLERRLNGPFAAIDRAVYERLTKLEMDLLLVELGSGDRDSCSKPRNQASA